MRRCLREDETPSVRQSAADSLAELQLENPDITALMEQARLDDHCEVRLASVRTVALCCKGSPAARDFLIERSTEDFQWVEDEVEPYNLGEEVRSLALIGLARGWSDDLEVHSWIRSLALQGDPEERGKAIEILVRSWPDNQQARECLLNVVATEPIPGLVGTALKGLAFGGSAEGGTLLRAKFNDDPRPLVRLRAAEHLVSVEGHVPEIRDLILRAAAEDQDSNTRYGLLTLAARQWPAELLLHPVGSIPPGFAGDPRRPG